MKCETCNGTGKITIRSTTWNKAGEIVDVQPVTIRCYWCMGTGDLMLQDKAVAKQFNNLWCKCQGHVEAKYVPEGQGVVNVHHWVCETCGKIVQIG